MRMRSQKTLLEVSVIGRFSLSWIARVMMVGLLFLSLFTAGQAQDSQGCEITVEFKGVFKIRFDKQFPEFDFDPPTRLSKIQEVGNPKNCPKEKDRTNSTASADLQNAKLDDPIESESIKENVGLFFFLLGNQGGLITAIGREQINSLAKTSPLNTVLGDFKYLATMERQRLLFQGSREIAFKFLKGVLSELSSIFAPLKHVVTAIELTDAFIDNGVEGVVDVLTSKLIDVAKGEVKKGLGKLVQKIADEELGIIISDAEIKDAIKFRDNLKAIAKKLASGAFFDLSKRLATESWVREAHGKECDYRAGGIWNPKNGEYTFIFKKTCGEVDRGRIGPTDTKLESPKTVIDICGNGTPSELMEFTFTSVQPLGNLFLTDPIIEDLDKLADDGKFQINRVSDQLLPEGRKVTFSINFKVSFPKRDGDYKISAHILDELQNPSKTVKTTFTVPNCKPDILNFEVIDGEASADPGEQAEFRLKLVVSDRNADVNTQNEITVDGIELKPLLEGSNCEGEGLDLTLNNLDNIEWQVDRFEVFPGKYGQYIFVTTNPVKLRFKKPHKLAKESLKVEVRDHTQQHPKMMSGSRRDNAKIDRIIEVNNVPPLVRSFQLTPVHVVRPGDGVQLTLRAVVSDDNCQEDIDKISIELNGAAAGVNRFERADLNETMLDDKASLRLSPRPFAQTDELNHDGYPIVLTVTDKQGQTNQDTEKLVVTRRNTPPVIFGWGYAREILESGNNRQGFPLCPGQRFQVGASVRDNENDTFDVTATILPGGASITLKKPHSIYLGELNAPRVLGRYRIQFDAKEVLDEDRGVFDPLYADPQISDLEVSDCNISHIASRKEGVVGKPIEIKLMKLKDLRSLLEEVPNAQLDPNIAPRGTDIEGMVSTGLPSGLRYDPLAGAILGTPSKAGEYHVLIYVRDKANQPAFSQFRSFPSDIIKGEIWLTIVIEEPQNISSIPGGDEHSSMPHFSQKVEIGGTFVPVAPKKEFIDSVAKGRERVKKDLGGETCITLPIVGQICQAGTVAETVAGVRFELAPKGTEFDGMKSTNLPKGLELDPETGALVSFQDTGIEIGTFKPLIRAVDTKDGRVLAELWIDLTVGPLIKITISPPTTTAPKTPPGGGDTTTKTPGGGGDTTTGGNSCAGFKANAGLDQSFTFNNRPLFINVQFSGSVSGATNITSWKWDFGDTKSATGQSLNHKYNVCGGSLSFSSCVSPPQDQKTVTLTVTDKNCGTKTDMLVVSFKFNVPTGGGNF